MDPSEPLGAVSMRGPIVWPYVSSPNWMADASGPLGEHDEVTTCGPPAKTGFGDPQERAAPPWDPRGRCALLMDATLLPDHTLRGSSTIGRSDAHMVYASRKTCEVQHGIGT